MTARAAPSPRLLQPYSPRRPSPLGLPPMGFPPLAPHMAFQSPPYPVTPDRHIQPRGPTESRVPFPPEARRPLAGTTQRSQSALAPLTLNTTHHPPTKPQHNGPTQPGAKQDMTMRRSPPSPTPSETSSLSLYSAESTKNFPIDVVDHDQKQQGEDDKSSGLFCACLNFRALFGSKPKTSRILAPPAPPVAAPAPQMVQTRRRPSPLNL